MKIKCLLGLIVLVLGSCAELMDLPLQDNENEPRSLEVSVYHEPISKGRIDGNYLPPSSEIGVFVRAMDGGLYNGQALDNIRYSASGTESGQTWIMDSATPIELYALKAKAYAYYPRINESISIKQIPLINDGTDWMYTEIPAMNLSNKQPLAQIKMVHAMTIVRCQLIKDDYEGPGVIQGLGVQSEGLAKSAVLDLSTSTFSSYGEQGKLLLLNDVGTLGDEPMTADIWAVPTQVASDFTVVILLDDNVYNVTIPNYMVNKGVINTITISVRSKSIDVCSTSVSPWNVSDNVSLESDYMGRDLEYAWKLAKQSSGVYAIDTNGFPVPSEEALDDSYSGVAFTVNGKAYQVAKVDAFGSDGTKIVYWWKNNYEDLVELPNYTKVNNANNNGFLPLPDGSNSGTLDNNYQEWINLTENVAALSDFNGQLNTSLLVEYLGEMDNTIGRAVVDFRNNEDINEGYDDWFIPSCGQMGCMAILSDKIDNLLTKIPGAETLCREDKTDYWSSTEGSRATAWYVGLFDGGVGQQTKYNDRSKRCRLIREL